MLNDHSPQIAALWEDLKQLTESVLAEMNRDAEISNRTGGLESRCDDGETLVVSQVFAPQMYLTVRLDALGLEVHTRLCVEPDLVEREFRETLTIHASDHGAALKNPAGEVFTVDEAVFYILRPFLHLGAANC